MAMMNGRMSWGGRVVSDGQGLKGREYGKVGGGKIQEK